MIAKYKILTCFLLLGGSYIISLFLHNDQQIAGLQTKAYPTLSILPTITLEATVTIIPTQTKIPIPTSTPKLVLALTDTPIPSPTKVLVQQQVDMQEQTEPQRDDQTAKLLKAYNYCLKMNDIAKDEMGRVYIDATDYCNNSLKVGFFYNQDGCPVGAESVCNKYPN